MKLECYIDAINKQGRQLRSKYPAFFINICCGYLHAVRDLAARDPDVSISDYDKLLAYLDQEEFDYFIF